jgi:PAS domain S-box-containing protein
MKMNSWGVLFSVPTYQIQLMTLSISAPLLGLVALVALGTMLVINQGVNSISYSIKNLSDQALQLSRGELERAFPEGGEDEIGDLQRSFEYLRISLKNRLDELNRLLSVSLGIASNLELANAIQPILEAALVGGACSARIVILPMVVPEMESSPALPLRFSAGPARELYADLDDQILGYTRQQQRLVLTSLTRPRLMNVTKNSPQPASLLAYSLQGEKEFYGALWIGFDRTHRFDNEEIRYISTLASQASLAISHAKHYLNAEVGRQRLAAILDSSPDPVLVTDQNNRLIIANPAAWTALGLGINYDQGQPIEQVLSQKDLVELLKDRDNSQKSIEVTSRDGLVYLAMATPVIAEGEIVGRVCILRDVTQFKELDALKTEFVANVSHDLREPLSHIRGYTTMLEMVGPLNEQQSGYVKKIVSNVDSMSHLINNLLDLSRIGAGIDLQVEKTTVPELIEPVITALQMQAVQKRIDLSVHLPDEPLPPIEVDTTLLHQALYNLVENAIKFTRVDGKVTISFELSPGQVTFVVTDTGVGIGPMDQPRVFEPFYRIAQPSAKDPPGAGLGLAIVKSIAERHRGQAWVKSQLGKGSKFYMSVPIVHAKTTRKN